MHHLPKLVRLETGAGKTLGSSGASSGVGGTALTASAFSSLIGAEVVNGAGVGGAILFCQNPLRT